MTWSKLWPVALAVGLIAGCSGAQTGAHEAAHGDLERRCLLLTTNDSEANFDGLRQGKPPALSYVGTITRIAAEKRRLLKQRPGGVLLVSAGDVLQGRYMVRKDRDRKRAAREAWQLYERAGYDVGVLGNHEFDAGPAVLKHALEGLKRFRIVVSNLDPSSPTLNNAGEKLYTGLLIKRCGGLKIGFFGLLTPSTRNISDFGDTRMSDPSDPIIAPAKRAVAALRKARVDVVVALTHLGYRTDKKLARRVRGIDVIIGGHSHTLLKTWRREGETVVVQTGERFGHLGYLDLKGRRGGGLIHASSSWAVRAIDAQLPRDPEVRQALGAFRGAYAAERVVGQRSVAWQLRGRGRMTYGKRVARAVMHYAARQRPDQPEVVGALLNMGGLRTNTTYRPGPVTDLEVRAIHPFGNRIVHVTLTGLQLQRVLEHACTTGHRGNLGSRVALWGVSMRCDGGRQRIRYQRKAGRVIGVREHGQRVVDLRVGGQPVDPERTYAIATNDYMARGGSGFWLLAQQRRTCMDKRDFSVDRCKGSTTLAEVVEGAVTDGSFDMPL